MNHRLPIPYRIIWTAIIAVVIFFFVRSCKCNHGEATTSVRVDTVWAVIKGDTVYQPKPYTITVQIPGKEIVVTKTDTLETFETIPTDTAKILERYYQKVFYSDTLHNQYGKIVVDDSVTTNRITSRKVTTDLKIPEVTKTITITQKRNVVYIGANVLSSLESPVVALGGDLTFKNKSDRQFSIGAFATKEGKMYYSFGYKAPIRLKKQ